MCISQAGFKATLAEKSADWSPTHALIGTPAMLSRPVYSRDSAYGSKIRYPRGEQRGMSIARRRFSSQSSVFISKSIVLEAFE